MEKVLNKWRRIGGSGNNKANKIEGACVSQVLINIYDKMTDSCLKESKWWEGLVVGVW